MDNKKQKISMFKIILLLCVIFYGYQLLQSNDQVQNGGVTHIGYSNFLDQVKNKQIKEVVISGNHISAKTSDGRKVETSGFYSDRGLISDLRANSVEFDIKAPEEQSLLWQLFLNFAPMLLIAGAYLFFMKKMNGGKSIFSFGKSKAKLINPDTNKVRFADVAGCDEAKHELVQTVEFLRNPEKFQSVGGKMPRGVLLVGPPGTGKTLLARAVAGEAKVPFMYIAGSEFVEMFAGLGAARVRDMFADARKNKSCIIFIDEIDSIGGIRGSGIGGNDEREQTLNQLLVEMDGFETHSGIMIIAATNRAELLDKALLRPGRFDRQVTVGLPDVKGREEILNVHLRKVTLTNDVDSHVLARGTPGFSGAELANLVNEAALFAAERNKGAADMQDFEDAKDKIYMGPARKSVVVSEEDRSDTAYHESGHAVTASLLPIADPVHKVTIMPRGNSAGSMWQLPEKDSVHLVKEKMLANIAILFAGRIAEELFIGRMSTGASNDFERATNIARLMVTRFGMSKELGTMVYEDNPASANYRAISESTLRQVDSEIRAILDRQYKVAKNILENHKYEVEMMRLALIKWDTINSEQVKQIMDGKVPTPISGGRFFSQDEIPVKNLEK